MCLHEWDKIIGTERDPHYEVCNECGIAFRKPISWKPSANTCPDCLSDNPEEAKSGWRKTNSIDEVWKALDAGKRVTVEVDGYWESVANAQGCLWNIKVGWIYARKDYQT
jgi:hypothetical protein